MAAQAAGGLEAFSLSQRPGWAHYFAVRAIDANNLAPLSNVVRGDR